MRPPRASPSEPACRIQRDAYPEQSRLTRAYTDDAPEMPEIPPLLDGGR